MNKILEFKDLGFKLAVINILMYEEEILTPKVDAYQFIEKLRGLKQGEGYHVLEEKGDPYAVIPEVMEYFKNIEITSDMVKNIEEIYTDGGDEIYSQIIPIWNGENNVFNIKSACDTSLLPQLKKITLFYDRKSLLKEFEEKGIKAEWT
ncbi:hypothetical protein OAT18_01440 [Tenacibaculum sp.]|nr:hypothetical protein [Tenacibaculum sp.]